MKRPIVVNKKYSRFDLYIGRGSFWGNPFKMVNRYSPIERLEVISKYREYILPILETKSGRRRLRRLSGKVLGCHCKPHPCHGDVLVELFNRYFVDNVDTSDKI